MQIGVLALQGDFLEHAQMLRRLGATVVEVRLPADLEGLDGIVIPGGESTTIARLLIRYGLLEPLRARIRGGMPAMGTCAGMIVLAEHAEGLDREGLGLMAIDVKRNAFGRQVDSFEADLPMPQVSAEPVHAVFIRAPRIEHVRPPAQVLACLDDGTIIAARQGHMLALAFHPELTDDTRVHAYFLSMVRQRNEVPAESSG
jgi:5'-phosphate synthase pdxT subunit